MINPRTKGATGEQDIARDLNAIIDRVRVRLGMPAMDPKKPIVQRNSNQSAAGGCDLVGTFELAIEVKRQEQLAINTWWQQCVESAAHLGHVPVLLFRQNAKPGQRTLWRCILPVELPLFGPRQKPFPLRAEIRYEDFLAWFEQWVDGKYRANMDMDDNPAPIGASVDDTVLIVPTREYIPTLFDEERL